MSEMIQSLESRVLFSVSGAVAAASQLASDVGTARADASQYAAALKSDVQTIAADLKALPASTQNAKLLARLRADRLKWGTIVQQDVTVAVRAATARGTKTVSDAIQLFLHPNNALDARRLANDLNVIGGALAAPLGKLENDLSAGRSALVGDLNNIASANSSASTLSGDVNQIASDTQSAITQLTGDAQAIQADLQSIAGALNS